MLKQAVLRSGWSFPLARLFASIEPTILLYHGLPRNPESGQLDAATFERHLCFMREHFDFVRPVQERERRPRMGRPRVLLTFDDGFRNNAEVVAPILRRHEVPATFFISSYHSEPGRYLWFTYLRSLDKYFPGDGFWFRGAYLDMTKLNRSATMRKLWAQLLALPNHPREMYEAIESELPRLEEFMSPELLSDSCAGMTAEQVRKISEDPLFSIGIHSDSHPYLSKCDPAESLRQIVDNKRWLEEVSGRSCDTIAYPIGDYDERVVQQCLDLRLKRGYAVIPELRRYPDYEVPRLGVYSQSTDVLGIKVQWGRAIRRLGIRVGRRMRVVFFAGPDALDDALFRYIYARVADRFGDVHIVMVRKGPKKSALATLRRKIKHLGLFQFLEVASGYPLQRFFQSRDGTELCRRLDELVRPEREPDLSRVSWVSSVNGDDVLTTMGALRPDVIIQAGAGILRRKVFSCARICTLNMHHGIAPLIRGMSSIYWALWEREPAWIGATVHMIDDGIDTGDVLAYAPIRLKDASEGFPSLFVRATEEGVTQLLGVLDRLAVGDVWRLPIPQGRQVYRSTFSGWRMLLLAVRRCVRI